MEDEHDEQDGKLLVDGEREANEHAVQQHTELEDRDTDDLARGRVRERARVVVRIAPALDVLLRVRVRVRRLPLAPVVMVVEALRVAPVARLLLVHVAPSAREHSGLLLLAVGLRAVRSVRGEPVAVCIVHDPQACEACGAPAEGDQLNDEDGEDADQADAQRVGLERGGGGVD